MLIFIMKSAVGETIKKGDAKVNFSGTRRETSYTSLFLIMKHMFSCLVGVSDSV